MVTFGGIGKWGNNEQIDDTYCLSNRGRSIFFLFSSKTSNLFVFQEISKSRFSFIFDFVSSRNTNGFHRIQFSLSMESATRWKGLNSVHRILNTPVTSINRIRSELFFFVAFRLMQTRIIHFIVRFIEITLQHGARYTRVHSNTHCRFVSGISTNCDRLYSISP